MSITGDKVTLVFSTEEEWLAFLELCKQEKALREKAREPQLVLIEK